MILIRYQQPSSEPILILHIYTPEQNVARVVPQNTNKNSCSCYRIFRKTVSITNTVTEKMDPLIDRLIDYKIMNHDIIARYCIYNQFHKCQGQQTVK